MATGDRNMNLGTIFTGKMDQSFMMATRRLRNIITGLAGQMSAAAKASTKVAKGFNSAGSEMSAYQLAAAKAAEKTKGYQKSFAGLAEAQGKSTQALNRWLPSLNKADEAIRRQSMSMTAAGRNGKSFYESANRNSVMQAQLAGKIKYTSAGFESVGKAATGAGNAMKKTTPLVKAHGDAQKWTGRQIGEVHGGLNRIYAAMRVTASYGIAATAIYTVVNAFKSAANIIMEYDQALKNLQAITRATDTQVALMGRTIEEIANRTKYSVAEIAQGAVVLGQAGFDAGESIDAMAAIAALATGTMSDMTLVTDLMTTTIRAYNLEAIEAERVSDVMASAINNSKLNVDKLRIAFNYVGAIAGQANITLEETAAAMMNLADNGLRASTIGTGLRQIISRLLAPGRKVRDAYAAMGVELEKISPIHVGFQQSMKNLAKVLYDAENKTVDMAKAFQLFGLRGAQSAAVIVRAFMTGKFQEALKNVYKVGSAQEMMEKQAEGLALRLKNLSDRFGLLAVAMGDQGAAGALGAFIDMMRDFVEFLTTSVRDGVAGVVLQFTAWSVTIGLTGMALKGLYKLMGWLVLKKFAASLRLVTMTFNGTALAITRTSGALAAFGKVVALTGGPIMWIAVALGIAVTWFRRWTSATERQIKALKLQGEELLRARASLDSYRGQIEDISKRWKEGHDVSEEYNAALQRLIKAHPDLAEEMDLTGVSAKSLATNIDLLTEAAYRKLEAGLSNTINTLMNQEQQLKKVREKEEALARTWESETHFLVDRVKLYNEYKNAIAATKIANDEVMATAAKLILGYSELVKAERMTEEAAIAHLESYVELNSISKELGDYIIGILVKAFNKAEVSIKDTTDELDEFKRTAEETADAIKKIKEANDEWLGKADLASRRRLVELGKSLLEGTVLEENAAEETAKIALKKAEDILEIERRRARQLAKYVGDDEKATKAYQEAVDALLDAELDVAEKTLALEKAKQDARKKTADATNEAQEEVEEAQKKAVLAVLKAQQALREADEAALRRWIENEGKRVDATKEAQEEIAKIGKTEEELKLEAIEKRRQEIAKLFKDEVAANEWAAWEIEKLQDKTEEGFENLRKAIEAWGKDSAEAIADFVTGASTSFKDMITGMIHELITLAAYRNITAPLFESISGAVTSGSGGLSGFLAKLFGRASGGPTRSGGMYEVNEKGHPELLNIGRRQYLMMGNRDGYVTPLKSENATGSSDAAPSMEMKVNIINNAGADVKTQQRQGQNGPELDVVLDRVMSQNLVGRGKRSNMALRRNFGMREMLVTR